jgi:hypothetical protein
MYNSGINLVWVCVVGQDIISNKCIYEKNIKSTYYGLINVRPSTDAGPTLVNGQIQTLANRLHISPSNIIRRVNIGPTISTQRLGMSIRFFFHIFICLILCLAPPHTLTLDLCLNCTSFISFICTFYFFNIYFRFNFISILMNIISDKYLAVTAVS